MTFIIIYPHTLCVCVYTFKKVTYKTVPIATFLL